MELCTAYRNTDLCAHRCLICFTGTISLTVFACFSDFTSITFTVNNNFPFLLPYITNSWLSAFYRERIAFLLKCFSRRLSQKSNEVHSTKRKHCNQCRHHYNLKGVAKHIRQVQWPGARFLSPRGLLLVPNRWLGFESPGLKFWHCAFLISKTWKSPPS